MDALHYNLLLILSLLFAIFILYTISEKLRISFPVLLVIGGLTISMLPHVPHVAINPELIFLIFLPPLLYEAAWNTSWHHFWKRRRTISFLAFGLVIFTCIVLAYFSRAFIPGFTLAMGFLLGAIISPTDAISAISILKGGKVPKRVQTILEGESLINDAGSLIVFRFALAAIITGQFKTDTAIGDFFLVGGMGVVTGLVIAYIVFVIYKLLPDTPSIDTSLTIMTPYIMYVAAEHFNFSGVMAVVSGGLFLSFRSHRFLKYDSRIQAHNVWTIISFLLNGAVFILIGLQLPIVVQNLNNINILDDGTYYGLIISALAIIVRFIWVYPAMFLPRLLSKRIRTTEKNPGWRGAFLVSWSGMRGVLSLAAALSLPLTLPDGTPFPQRDLILFITFVVIIFSLLVQGLSLPVVIRKLKIKEFDIELSDVEQEIAIRRQLLETSLNFFEEKYADQISQNGLFARIKTEYENKIIHMTKPLEEDSKTDLNEMSYIYYEALLDVVAIQRKELVKMRSDTSFDDVLLRKHEAQLDLEEASINMELAHSKLKITEGIFHL